MGLKSSLLPETQSLRTLDHRPGGALNWKVLRDMRPKWVRPDKETPRSRKAPHDVGVFSLVDPLWDPTRMLFADGKPGSNIRERPPEALKDWLLHKKVYALGPGAAASFATRVDGGKLFVDP